MGSGLGLRLLSSLRHLERLNLGGTVVSSAGLQQVAQLTGLRLLGLRDCRGVGDAELRHLASGPLAASLTRLVLRNTAVGDSGVACLSGLVRLNGLDLHRCRRVGPAGLAALAALRGLQELSLSSCATGAQPAQLAEALAELTGLLRLDLTGHAVKGEAAAALLGLPSLTVLMAGSIDARGGGGAGGGLEPGSEQRPAACAGRCCMQVPSVPAAWWYRQAGRRAGQPGR